MTRLPPVGELTAYYYRGFFYQHRFVAFVLRDTAPHLNLPVLRDYVFQCPITGQNIHRAESVTRLRDYPSSRLSVLRGQ